VIDRFKAAQNAADAWSGSASAFDAALAEIKSGGKRGHWIWYVFPQIAGLGSSSASRFFAIEDEEEAAAYLRDAELRSRLLTITTAVADQLKAGGKEVRALMGSDTDARKLVSSLTLFEHVAKRLSASESEGSEAYTSIADATEDVLTIAASQGYPRCDFTLRQLTG
jgi:uncharacterized protein (DUF1810 family)